VYVYNSKRTVKKIKLFINLPTYPYLHEKGRESGNKQLFKVVLIIDIQPPNQYFDV